MAFGLALWLSTTEWSEWVVYVDPALVGILSLLMISMPLRIVRHGLGELLLESPDKSVQEEVEARFDEITQHHLFEKTVLRMTRIGRRSVLMAHVVVSDGFRIEGVGQLDAIRDEIEAGIRDSHPSWTVDVIFVADEKHIF